MANWLKKRPFAGCPKVEIITGKEFRKKLNERTGIVFLKTIGKEMLIMVKIVQEIILIYGMVEDLIN